MVELLDKKTEISGLLGRLMVLQREMKELGLLDATLSVSRTIYLLMKEL